MLCQRHRLLGDHGAPAHPPTEQERGGEEREPGQVAGGREQGEVTGGRRKGENRRKEQSLSHIGQNRPLALQRCSQGIPSTLTPRAGKCPEALSPRPRQAAAGQAAEPSRKAAGERCLHPGAARGFQNSSASCPWRTAADEGGTLVLHCGGLRCVQKRRCPPPQG